MDSARSRGVVMKWCSGSARCTPLMKCASLGLLMSVQTVTMSLHRQDPESVPGPGFHVEHSARVDDGARAHLFRGVPRVEVPVLAVVRQDHDAVGALDGLLERDEL